MSARTIQTDLHMSENELRKHVNRLRRECIPIGSSSNGYYFAETAAEVCSARNRAHALVE